eukprot:TRINITY_DN6199_c0_g1_i2.p1 TRINITY_DN6199_c0_g1~~TRINITY_DN6199_c0_g1_i2.p1  ORF type:complete len:105 (-),score=4.48 TRINITY_DN6199_c0_g1_i2:411-725(-)
MVQRKCKLCFMQLDPSRFVTRHRDKRSMMGGVVFLISALSTILFVTVFLSNKLFYGTRFAYCLCGKDAKSSEIYFTNVCPWLNDGAICDNNCLEETAVDDRYLL